MTPRAYWDRDDTLWEQRPGGDGVRPVISFDEDGRPVYAIGPGHDSYWQRAVVERLYGPLVAVA